MSQVVRSRCPASSSRGRKRGKELYSSPFCAAHTVPVSFASGWRPPATSRMLRRTAPRLKRSRETSQESSGPRWRITASMRRTVSASDAPNRVASAMKRSVPSDSEDALK